MKAETIRSRLTSIVDRLESEERRLHALFLIEDPDSSDPPIVMAHNLASAVHHGKSLLGMSDEQLSRRRLEQA